MHETPEYKFCLVLDSARKLNANRRIAKSPMMTANTVNPISMLSNLQQSNSNIGITATVYYQRKPLKIANNVYHGACKRGPTPRRNSLLDNYAKALSKGTPAVQQNMILKH